MDVVILGGGIVGVSTAYFLSLRKHEIASVTIVEKYEIAGCASGKAGGFLARNWCDYGPMKELAQKGYDLHADLAKEFGSDITDYRTLNTLQVEVGHPLGRLANCKPPIFVDGGMSSSSEIGSHETTAQVNPKKLVNAMLEVAVTNGVKIKIAGAKGVRFNGRQVSHIELDNEETLPCSVVVVAMGPWSVKASEWFALPRITSYKTHSMILRPSTTFEPTAIFATVPDDDVNPEIYPRPDGNVFVCGAADKKCPLPENPADVLPAVGVCDKLHSVVSRIASSLTSARVVVEQACYLPVSFDNVPIIGNIPESNGAFVATGHACWGILTGPITGKAMSGLIIDGKSSCIDLSVFNPNRLL